MKFSVRNLTRGSLLGESIELADTSELRRTGLLKRKSLESGQGLWIVPCEAVHTFFMKFAIDIVYLDRQRKVKKAVGSVMPWRLSACLVAHSTLELPSGTIAGTGTQAGDQLEFNKI